MPAILRFPCLMVALLVFNIPLSSAADSALIRVQPQRTTLDGSHRYFIDLLQRVIEVTEDEFGPARVETSRLRFSQARAFQAVTDHQIDVFWAGTNPDRELPVAPVRVPLYGGLLGVRVPVIRRADKARFDAIENDRQLQAMLACQGDHWPDSDILEANHYRVQRVTLFEVMYNMLQSGRCDYFPRGLNEVYAEVGNVQRHDLMAYDRLLLSYPFPMYFFVAQDNPQLLKRLETGMNQLVDSGELWRFMQQHETTRQIFPLDRLRDSTIFHLTNPLLPDKTPLDDQRLWLRIE